MPRAGVKLAHCRVLFLRTLTHVSASVRVAVTLLTLPALAAHLSGPSHRRAAP